MMMKAFAAAALCGALLLPLRVTAADPGQTTIYSTGQATVSAPPDVAIVSFSIASHASTAEQATGLSNTVYAHLTTGMRTIGIAAADIKTTSYTLNHVPPPPPCPPPVQPQARAPNAILVQETPCVRDPQTWGYFVNRSVTVTVHHLDLVGKIIDTAVAAGVNNVESVDYGLSDTKPFFLRALGAAVVSARTQADAMAQAAGLHIVRVVSINSSNPTPLRTIASVMSRAAGTVYQAPTQISPPSSLDVSANVSVVYLAQP